MDEYTEIRIEVLAPSEDINGKNEMALADALYEIERELEQWLQKRAFGTKFLFRIIEEG